MDRLSRSVVRDCERVHRRKSKSPSRYLRGKQPDSGRGVHDHGFEFRYAHDRDRSLRHEEHVGAIRLGLGRRVRLSAMIGSIIPEADIVALSTSVSKTRNLLTSPYASSYRVTAISY